MTITISKPQTHIANQILLISRDFMTILISTTMIFIKHKAHLVGRDFVAVPISILIIFVAQHPHIVRWDLMTISISIPIIFVAQHPHLVWWNFVAALVSIPIIFVAQHPHLVWWDFVAAIVPPFIIFVTQHMHPVGWDFMTIIISLSMIGVIWQVHLVRRDFVAALVSLSIIVIMQQAHLVGRDFLAMLISGPNPFGVWEIEFGEICFHSARTMFIILHFAMWIELQNNLVLAATPMNPYRIFVSDGQFVLLRGGQIVSKGPLEKLAFDRETPLFTDAKSANSIPSYSNSLVIDDSLNLLKKYLSPHYVLYFDGAAKGNNLKNRARRSAIGTILYRDGVLDATFGEFIGDKTNNEAEYTALLRGLELAQARSIYCLEICGDSELVCRQVSGQYAVKNENLRTYHTKVMQILATFDIWSIGSVPRAQNSAADELANSYIPL